MARGESKALARKAGDQVRRRIIHASASGTCVRNHVIGCVRESPMLRRRLEAADRVGDLALRGDR